MSETHTTPEPRSEDQYEAGLYEIRIQGHLGDQWADWFGGMTITPEDNGITLLTGRIVDQAALHGLLRKLRTLAVRLISVNPITADQSATSYTES